MEMSTVVMAYAAALIVAFVTTVAFTPPIQQMLFRLLPQEAASPWSMFVRFALFATSFVGGKPVPVAGAVIDRSAAAAAAPPLAGDNFMTVMNSMGGALMAAAWFLLAFFAGTLAALTAIRIYAVVSQRRALAAERDAEKTRQDRTETHGEPIKRREASEPRPVKQQEKPAPRPPQPR